MTYQETQKIKSMYLLDITLEKGGKPLDNGYADHFKATSPEDAAQEHAEGVLELELRNWEGVWIRVECDNTGKVDYFYAKATQSSDVTIT